MGNVFHIQRFSLYDGPGVRTVVFLKGCPLRCLWCHNPEGLSTKQQVQFNPTKCIGCLDCASVCPNGCHKQEDEHHIYNRALCTACGQCAGQCCSDALSISGMEMSAEEVMSQVLKDRSVYSESDGGLTLSGGEPFAQPKFAIALLRLAKEHALHTCVETCGYTSADILSEAAKYTDLFLYDYKLTDEDLHRKFCGVSNQKILGNLNLLDELGAEVILRCPIVPGCNDDDSHIQAIGKLAASHRCIKENHLEPYHRLGIDKSVQLGTLHTFETTPPDSITMEQYRYVIETISQKPTLIS